MHDLPKKRSRRKRNTLILSYCGTEDGIRYGRLRFAGYDTRTFHFDRLNRVLRIYTTCTNTARPLVYDTDPERLASAMAVLLAREPIA